MMSDRMDPHNHPAHAPTMPPARRKHAPESDLVRACLAYLDAVGVFAWRNNSGATRIGDRFIRFGRRGSADILGVLGGGRILAIECKVGRGRTTPEQDEFLSSISSRGGLAFVARSVEDVVDQIMIEQRP